MANSAAVTTMPVTIATSVSIRVNPWASRPCVRPSRAGERWRRESAFFGRRSRFDRDFGGPRFFGFFCFDFFCGLSWLVFFAHLFQFFLRVVLLLSAFLWVFFGCFFGIFFRGFCCLSRFRNRFFGYTGFSSGSFSVVMAALRVVVCAASFVVFSASGFSLPPAVHAVEVCFCLETVCSNLLLFSTVPSLSSVVSRLLLVGFLGFFGRFLGFVFGFPFGFGGFFFAHPFGFRFGFFGFRFFAASSLLCAFCFSGCFFAFLFGLDFGFFGGRLRPEIDRGGAAVFSGVAARGICSAFWWFCWRRTVRRSRTAGRGIRVCLRSWFSVRA